MKIVEKDESGNHYSIKLVFLIRLDVKNAFNSANWACQILVKPLEESNMIGDVRIHTKVTAKYLGVTVDTRLSFW